MNNLLAGNGINIQFNHVDYTAQQIVLRVLKNCDRDDFPSHIVIDKPYLLKNYIGQLYLEAQSIVDGEYDVFPVSSVEKESLKSFKERYSSAIDGLRITDIGFEDYYLVHDLVCHKTKTINPQQYQARECMRAAYLLAIYNDGKLNKLYQDYPEPFLDYLMSFENIFTTNYDVNLELATRKPVFHIHGQFDQKSNVYIERSLRNQLPDAPIKNLEIDEDYYFIYSNALTTHCGAYKELQIKQIPQANEGIEKMAVAYRDNPDIKAEIDSWTKEPNILTANMGYAIQMKASDPSLSFLDNYHFDAFKQMSGSLEILGLSPWNDFHIFESVDSSKIDSCTYYYYSENDCAEIEKLLPHLAHQGKLNFSSVKDFWRGFEK